MKNNLPNKFIFNTLLYGAIQLLFIDKALMNLGTTIMLPIYLIPLLTLPINTNKYHVLMYSLIVGVLIDTFSFSLGLFTIATVTLGFIRYYILDFIATKNKFSNDQPTIKILGLPFFITYFAFNYFLFFTTLVVFEFFHFKSFWYNFSVIFYNTIINTIIIICL